MEQEIKLSNIFHLAWPSVISHAIVILVSIIDLAFVGRISQTTLAIAAVAIANNICAGIYNFLEGIRTGTTILTSRFLGAKKHNAISKTLNLAFIFAIIIGVFLLFITPPLVKFLYGFIEDTSVRNIGISYISIRLLGIPFLLIIFAITGFYRGLKNTIIPLTITLTICFLNATLNYLFINGKLGLPMMGTNGAAYATLTTYIIATFLVIALLFRTKSTAKYINFTIPIKSIFKEYVKTGSEIGLYHGMTIIAFFAFVFMFIQLGTQAIATHQIVLQVFLILNLIPTGLFVATSIIIGKLLGGSHYAFANIAIKRLLIISLTLAAGINILVAVFAKNIASFFSPHDMLVAQQATKSIYIICVALIFNSLTLVLRGTLNAAKDTRFIAIACGTTGYFIFLPLAYFCGIKLGYGVFGGYVAFAIWFFIDCIVLTHRLFVQKIIPNSKN
jgi:multidrug resistance protein, MATE family